MPDPIEQEIGQTIKRAREAAGLSQRELGARIGVSGEQVRKYEVGKDRVAASRLMKLREVLNLPPSLFASADPRPGFSEGEQSAYQAESPEAATVTKIHETLRRVSDPARLQRILDYAAEQAELEDLKRRERNE